MTDVTVTGQVSTGAGFTEAGFTEAQRAQGFFLVVASNAFALWVPRRWESVELIDHSTAKRKMRLDVDLGRLANRLSQAGLATLPGDGGQIWVPLANLDRGSHASVEAYDDEGVPLPRLAKREERQLITAGILYFAERLLGQELVPCVAESLSTLLHRRPGALGLKKTLSLHAQGKALLAHAGFVSILRQSVENYALAVPLNHSTSRQVVFYEQIESFRPKASKLNFRGVFGWSRCTLGRVEIGLTCPSAGDSESFHLALTAPTNLCVSSATMRFRTRVGQDRRWKHKTLRNQNIVPNSAHGYIDNTRYDGVAKPEFQVFLRHAPSGIVRTAVFSSLLNSIVLGGLLWAVVVSTGHEIRSDLPTTTALLLLFPALLGTAIAQPTSHTLTAQVTFPTRLILAVTSLFPWAMAFPMVAHWHGPRMLITSGLACFTALCVTYVMYAQLRNLRRFAGLDRPSSETASSA